VLGLLAPPLKESEEHGFSQSADLKFVGGTAETTGFGLEAPGCRESSGRKCEDGTVLV